ncbi:MAG: alpha/beta hydrolase [Propionibacteriales bacterium]|nr:alpha/beta hydrolase [Propionibacteriales bacterium]
MTSSTLAALQAWRDGGKVHSVAGRDVFVHDTGTGPTTVLIHGFPGSSFDWAEVVDLLGGRVIAFDLPGYGFSDKSPTASYSLFDQADIVEALLAQLGTGRCRIVAHDMGDTVTAELAHRANNGTLGFDLEQIVLTNGSIFIDQAQLTRGQRLTLRLPDRVSSFSMPTFVLRRSLGESFARSAPAPAGAIDTLIAAIRHDRGDRLMPRLIRYIEERRVHQDRWTTGFVDFDGPLALVWGTEDPIAVLAMTDRMKALRPSTTVVALPGVGHWPSIEAPALLAQRISEQLG